MQRAMPDVNVTDPEIPDPPSRRLRVYAKDPSFASQLDTVDVNEVTLDVRWETLTKHKYSFNGEYIVVDDQEGRSSGYASVDLDDPRLLATDGWIPSEGNPQFHQQMVYGVAMKTVEHFERALGRPLLWRHRPNPDNPYDDSDFVGQLAIRPHALQTANAYYSPAEIALKFGFYPAPAGGRQIPGSPVYTCLSHDIVVHETTHAVLDGMYGRFNEPSNPDVLALHEGFADIVALLQQFANPDLLLQAINQAAATSRPKQCSASSRSSSLRPAEAGRRSAARSAPWSTVSGSGLLPIPPPSPPRPLLTPAVRSSWARCSMRCSPSTAPVPPTCSASPPEVPAPFRTAPSTQISPADWPTRPPRPPDQVLDMCIRALDFLPPVDVTFFDYLRALVTADYEVESHDPYNYRVAFVEAFARHGIFPGEHDEQLRDGPRALSADTLRWPSFGFDQLTGRQRTRA